MKRLLHYVRNDVYLLKCLCNCILWNKMESVTNTILPARKFVVCSKVCFGNGFKKRKG